MKNARTLVGLVLLAVVIMLGWRLVNTYRRPMREGAGRAPAEAPSRSEPPRERLIAAPPIRDRCPDLELVDPRDRVLHSDGYRGRVMVITFERPDRPLAEQVAVRLNEALGEQFGSSELAGDVVIFGLVLEESLNDVRWPPWIYRIPASANPSVVWARLPYEQSQPFLSWAGAQVAQWLQETAGRQEPPDASPKEWFSQFALLVDPQGDLRGIYDVRSSGWHERLLADCRHVLDERVLLIENQIEPRSVVRTLLDPPWLESRQRQQQEAAAACSVFTRFSFADRCREAGIRFRHRAVDDAGRSLVTAHYDHGNGMLAADVDNDGWIDLYFLNQVGPNELWRNRGDGTYENITNRAGVALADVISVSGVFADYDNDGFVDLFVTTVRGGNVLFRNDGTGVFENVSAEAGVDYVGHSSGAVFFDFDRDGWLDLFVVNVGVYTKDEWRTVVHDRYSGPDTTTYGYYASNPDAFAAHLKPDRAERSLLYRNAGDGRFEEVAESMGLIDYNWTGDASVVDFNRDGWLDLYLVCMQGHDEYYENQGGKQFIRRSRELFPATPWGSMGIKSFDFNNDGCLDLFVTDMHTDMLKNVSPREEKQKIPSELVDLNVWATDGNHILGNAFFLAVPEGTFQEISDQIGAEMYWPWGLSSGDFNADGFEDVFITASMNFPFRYAPNVLLLNDHGQRFVQAEFVVGIEPRRYRRTATVWFELDVLGRDARHPIAQLLAARQRHVTRAVVWGALGSRSSVVWDLDEDGDLDIVTNDFHSPPMVLVSDLKQQHAGQHYLKVRLIGRWSNRNGLGTVVRLTAGDMTQTKIHDGQSGYLSHSMLPLYFGLGPVAQQVSLEVLWPSGVRQKLENVGPVDRLLVVEEHAE